MNTLAAALVVLSLASPIASPGPAPKDAPPDRRKGEVVAPSPKPPERARLRGTEGRAFRDLVATTERAADAWEHQAHRSDWPWPTRITAAFTGLLVLVGAFQAWLIGKQWCTAQMMERGRIAVAPGKVAGADILEQYRREPHRLDALADSDIAAVIGGEIVFSNAGRSVAHVTDTLLCLWVGPRAAFPALPDYGQGRGDEEPSTFLIQPGGAVKDWTTITPVQKGIVAGLTSRENVGMIAVYGMMTYNDVSGDEHVSRFCFISRWQYERLRFFPGGGPAYNEYT